MVLAAAHAGGQTDITELSARVKETAATSANDVGVAASAGDRLDSSQPDIDPVDSHADTTVYHQGAFKRQQAELARHCDSQQEYLLPLQCLHFTRMASDVGCHL